MSHASLLRPLDYKPDPMTLGPRLPFGWQGDAWVQPCWIRSESYLLRAWSAAGDVIVARGFLYADARRRLLEQIDCVDAAKF